VSLIAHPLGIDMRSVRLVHPPTTPGHPLTRSWGTTSKSVEKSNFWKQLPKIIKAFWFQLTISFLVLVRLAALQ
jgi:hypothetical protein